MIKRSDILFPFVPPAHKKYKK